MEQPYIFFLKIKLLRSEQYFKALPKPMYKINAIREDNKWFIEKEFEKTHYIWEYETNDEGFQPVSKLVYFEIEKEY